MSTEDAQPSGSVGHGSRRRGLRLKAADIGFLCIPVVFGMWYLGFIHYLLGLANVVALFLVFCLIMALVPAALGFLILLTVRILVTGPPSGQTRRRLLLHWLAVTVGLVLFFGTFSTRITPDPYIMLAHGFRVHMRLRADVLAIQAWLDTLDPNDYRWDDGVSTGIPVSRSDRPRAIGRLWPKLVTVAWDNLGQKNVRMMWGGGFIGHWGLVVGDEDMEIPETELPGWDVITQGTHESKYYRYGRCRLPLAPGAYVWSELE